MLSLVTLVCSGCATFRSHEPEGYDSMVQSGVYRGVREDWRAIVHPEDMEGLGKPVFCLDLPFSFVADTLWLPFDATLPTVQTWPITGRILDARNLAPIKAAKICLSEHPDVSCESGSDGRFRLGVRHDPHLPDSLQWGIGLTISRAGYLTQKKDSGFEHIDRYWPNGVARPTIENAGDILLQPTQ